MSKPFKLHSDYQPTGDQPQAIDRLVQGIQKNQKHQVLLGITGSGKTFTMANIVQKVQKPTLILAHNKTLAAQLYKEFQAFFPENAVEYFVSFYDYYQPEAYLPQRDLFIEKDTALNEELERLRLSATRSLLERDDVLIVASVSCIYGLGSPEEYGQLMIYLKEGDEISREDLISQLLVLQYDRNDIDFHRGTFRVRGDVVEIFLAEKDYAIRVEMFGDEIEALVQFDPLTGKKQESLKRIAIYPASHYVSLPDRMPETISMIKKELEERLQEFKLKDKLMEYHRLKQRTSYDIEMLEETGFCSGIENYSRIIERRPPGSTPATLLSYLPNDALVFIDESHVSLPQIRGMYSGDRSRKETLVEHGFRLPCALDNRPYRFDEFEGISQQLVYVSATPGDYEIEKAQGQVVEQILRPTGLLDPLIEVRPVMGQVDDMLDEIRDRVQKNERVLITTLTKRMSEDLAEYYEDVGVKVRYLHSDIDAVERTQILHELREGKFDVLIGINLLREGLDLPEVSLVGIFDADKEGFLRSSRSLIQTTGRAARNVNGKVIMYADKVTHSMNVTIETTEQRRRFQEAYNQKHGITPMPIVKPMHTSIAPDPVDLEEVVAENSPAYGNTKEALEQQIESMQTEMMAAAEALEFEKAASLRDRIQRLQKKLAEQ